MKSKIERKDFYKEIYSIVKKIPSGKVITYGQLARLAGHPQHARLVGKALAQVPAHLHLPCHRVINSYGRPAPGWSEQADLLKQEGIILKKNGCVDIKKFSWLSINNDTPYHSVGKK